MDKWIGKSEDEIRDSIIEIAKKETGLTSFKEGGVLRGLVEVFAKTTYSLYQDVIGFYGGQFTYMEASGSMLDLRGRELGVERRSARKTLGVFRVNTTKSGTISEGTWFVTTSGLRFKAASNSDLSVGENQIEVEAEFAGATYNITQDSAIRSTTVLDGVDSIQAPEGWVSQSGRDIESDVDYKQRIAAKWSSQGQDNQPGKYVSIALAIEGVDDVKVIRTPRGSGSIDVVIAGYAESPDAGIRQAVIEALKESYLLTRDIQVKTAVDAQQSFELTFSGTVGAKQVEDTLRTWLQHRKIGEEVTMKALYQKVFSSLDIINLEFQKPAQDVEVDDYFKISASNISVTKEAE